MTEPANFMDELPIGDIRLGRNSFVRIYGYADIEPRLVELRIFKDGFDDVHHLHVEQAEKIGEALLAAAKKARGAAS